MKLTQKAIAALTLPDGKTDHIAWDDELPRFGFRLRRSHDGSKVLRSWIVQYSRGDRSPRIKLGDFSFLSAEQARSQAKKLLAQVALGEDPAAAKRDRHAKDALTMRALVDQYLKAKEADLAPRTFVESTRYLTDAKYFGPLHRMPLDQIALKDVAARIVAIKKLGNATASRARGALVTFFAWCMRQGLCTANPTIGSENVETRSRDRVLTPDELVAIWKACGDDHYGKIIKLLIASGCRRAEIGDMCESEIDRERGTFTIPKERAKTGKARVIPLLPMMLEIIKDVPRMASRDQLFGERSHGFTAWAKGKRALDQRCGVTNFTVHDLRRSVATHMAEELAIQPHIVELVLGHEFRTGVQATYNRAPYSKEIQNAYLCWHEYLKTLISGDERKVIPYIPPAVSPAAS
jgi:integrase